MDQLQNFEDTFEAFQSIAHDMVVSFGFVSLINRGLMCYNNEECDFKYIMKHVKVLFMALSDLYIQLHDFAGHVTYLWWLVGTIAVLYSVYKKNIRGLKAFVKVEGYVIMVDLIRGITGWFFLTPHFSQKYTDLTRVGHCFTRCLQILSIALQMLYRESIQMYLEKLERENHRTMATNNS